MGLLAELLTRQRGGGQVVALLEVAPRSDAAARARSRSRRRQIPALPDAIERQYRRALVRRIDLLERAVMVRVVPLLEALHGDVAGDVRRDGVASTVVRAVDSVRLAFVDGEPPREIKDAAAQLDLFAAREVERVTGRVPTVGANAIPLRSGALDGWISDQVGLIQSVDARYFDDVETLLREGIADGRNVRDLTREIAAKAPRRDDAPGPRVTAEYNARRIARDQVGTLNSAITLERYAAAGVAKYRWATAADERVRPSHWAQEGRIFDLRGPGAIGIGAYGRDVHPGQDIQCRCRMIPILDDEDAVQRPPTPEAEERRAARPTTRTAGRVRRAVEGAKDTAAAIWSTMQRTWVLGSRRKSSVELKKAAIAEFDLGGIAYTRRDFAIDPGRVRKAQGAVRDQYRATQSALREVDQAGTVRLYRGIKGTVMTPGAVESWTSDLAIARKFAGARGSIIVEDVAASRILAWHGGPGWQDGKYGRQSEWVILSDPPKRKGSK